MPVKPKDIISTIQPCPHGVVRPEEESAYGGEVLDFSVSSNPFGPPPGLKDYLDSVPVSKYPDLAASLFRAYAANKLDIRPTHVIAGNGSIEIIWLLSLAFLDPGDRVIIVKPTFG